ncbi:metallophosphoesterase [Candidatus Woesearchaeota archaeon]|jgi:uncharacterized protein|nr:metallophosphoesterase [Candidatus Woesearchaeota archaeon]MBT4322025.1 metallophosphoesterase [Candidatus Woesearchaeota archaeon]MBT4630771.1 metallophosphoesterase [Candidatus Woesearchaeota archaeon]
MEIQKNIEIIDLALYLKKEKILIISDLHLGYEEALNKQGILMPRFQFEDIIKRLKEILKKVNPELIIINGDLKHEFGTISRTEWKQVIDLIDFFKNKKILLIKGNHDNILGPIAKKKNVKLVENYEINNLLITHGHKIPKKLNKTIIIGHEHPAISFEGRKDQKYKCFLKGKYKRKNLIVMPSFNLIQQGTDVTKQKTLSPFLKKDLKNFEVYIVEDKVYKFGKIKKLKEFSS